MELVNLNERKRVIVPAAYHEQILPEHRFNPVIEALPGPFKVAEVSESLARYPEYHAEECLLDQYYRLQCVQRIKRYFQPMSRHLALERKISMSLRDGLVSRNPLGREYALRLQGGYKAIKSGSYDVTYQEDIESTASGFTIVGISGMGKSTTLNQILKLYPQAIGHSGYRDQELTLIQVTWLKLDCPSNGSLKALCVKFFTKMDELCGTEYLKMFGSQRNSVDTMLAQMGQVATAHCLGLLVIDEIQFLKQANVADREKMLNFFTSLVNMISLPVIFVGTPKAISVIQTQFRQARRGSGEGAVYWDRIPSPFPKKDGAPLVSRVSESEWSLFLEGLWTYRWIMNPEQSPLTDEIVKVMYDQSQGILDIAVKLFRLCQIRVIGKKREIIDVPLIRKVADEELRMIKPFIEALRENRTTDIEKYGDINFAEIESKIQDYMDNRERITAHDIAVESVQEKEAESNVISIAQRLVQCGIHPKKAQKAAEKALKSFGTEMDEKEIAKAALEFAMEISNQPKSRASKKTKQASPAVGALAIVEKGRKGKQTALDSLVEAGYSKDPLADEVLGL